METQRKPFKAVYKKYTNFGLQRFRLNFENQRNLSWNADTTYEFKIKRYAELIWDTYLVLNLPDIGVHCILVPI